eukprot:gene11341-biopygen22881
MNAGGTPPLCSSGPGPQAKHFWPHAGAIPPPPPMLLARDHKPSTFGPMDAGGTPPLCSWPTTRQALPAPWMDVGGVPPVWDDARGLGSGEWVLAISHSS